MRDHYVRRGDFDDLPWPIQLGILKTERDQYAETDEERKIAAESVARMEAVIAEFTPKPPRWTEENQRQRPR